MVDLYEYGNFNEYGGELGDVDWPLVLTLEREGIKELDEDWEWEMDERQYAARWGRENEL